MRGQAAILCSATHFRVRHSHASNSQCWRVSKNINKQQEVMWFICHSLKSEIQNNNRMLHYRLKKSLHVIRRLFHVVLLLSYYSPFICVLCDMWCLFVPLLCSCVLSQPASPSTPALHQLRQPCPDYITPLTCASPPASHPFLSLVCIEVVSSVQSSLTIISCIWAH